MAHGPLDHVLDSNALDFFGLEIHLPVIPGIDLQITKFMVMEVVAAALVVWVAVWMGKKASREMAPKGRFYHFWEAILVFVHKDVAEPNIGEHDAKRFLPFLWSLFLFILFANLLGMVPFGATATGSISVTAGLALCSFFAVHISGIRKLGLVHYFKAMVPPVPKALWPLMLVVELMGHLAKPFALCVRLFANMFAGHTVLFTILGFIFMASNWGAFAIVAPMSVLGVAALSLLELFVAFLQAYIFVFLTSIFVGMAVHPEH